MMSYFVKFKLFGASADSFHEFISNICEILILTHMIIL